MSSLDPQAGAYSNRIEKSWEKVDIMLEVQVGDDNVSIVFSRNLMKDDDLMEFIERIRAKHLISKKKLTEEQAEQLDTELKS